MGFPEPEGREGRSISKVRRPREVHGGWVSSLRGPEWLEDRVRGEVRGRGGCRTWPGKVGGSCRVLDLMVLATKISLLIFLQRTSGCL